jgi:hypothetical protein
VQAVRVLARAHKTMIWERSDTHHDFTLVLEI